MVDSFDFHRSAIIVNAQANECSKTKTTQLSTELKLITLFFLSRSGIYISHGNPQKTQIFASFFALAPPDSQHSSLNTQLSINISHRIAAKSHRGRMATRASASGLSTLIPQPSINISHRNAQKYTE